MNTQRVHTNEQCNVDVNPLLDVVFILLIFFIVLASFSKERTLTITMLSKVRSQQTPTTTTEVLTIDSKNRIYHLEWEINPAALRSYIIHLNAETADKLALMIKMHPLAKVNTYTRVLDAVRLAQVSAVASRVEETRWYIAT